MDDGGAELGNTDLNAMIRNLLLEYLLSLSNESLRQTTRKKCRRFLEKQLNQPLKKYKNVIKAVLQEYALQMQTQQIRTQTANPNQKLVNEAKKTVGEEERAQDGNNNRNDEENINPVIFVKQKAAVCVRGMVVGDKAKDMCTPLQERKQQQQQITQQLTQPITVSLGCKRTLQEMESAENIYQKNTRNHLLSTTNKKTIGIDHNHNPNHSRSQLLAEDSHSNNDEQTHPCRDDTETVTKATKATKYADNKEEEEQEASETEGNNVWDDESAKDGDEDVEEEEEHDRDRDRDQEQMDSSDASDVDMDTNETTITVTLDEMKDSSDTADDDHSIVQIQNKSQMHSNETDTKTEAEAETDAETDDTNFEHLRDIQLSKNLLIADNLMSVDHEVLMKSLNTKIQTISLYPNTLRTQSMEEMQLKLNHQTLACDSWKRKATMLAKILKPKEVEYQRIKNENLICNQNIEILKELHSQEIEKLKFQLKMATENLKDTRSQLLRNERYGHRLKKKFEYVCVRYNIDQDMIVAEMPNTFR